MTRSELIDLMADGQSQLSAKDVELAVKLLIDHMAETLSSGERIEIRGLQFLSALSGASPGSQSPNRRHGGIAW